MYPDKDTALAELEVGERMNPGLWTAHSRNVGEAARLIAEACPGMDVQKAHVCGLLHDIGRREGVTSVRHIVDGYDHCMSRGWDEVARVCLTHSFPVKDVDADIGRMDITEAQHRFVGDYLDGIEYDDYDRLIILCDSLADANGFCILERRFVDTTRRYGVFPFTVDRWNRTFEFKEYFERRAGQSIYRLLPGIEGSLYR